MPRETRHVEIPSGDVLLKGDLAERLKAKGLVIFAHGSGSGRLSPRNRFVSLALQEAGFSTLLADLLTEREEEIDRFTAKLRFDIRLLADRLLGLADWARRLPHAQAVPIAYFGASTGAAAALIAAAERPEGVFAVVSRGGRPDLAMKQLHAVKAPTLLIVGGDDAEVLRLNEAAARLLTAEHELRIVPRATHLFEEPGTLEKVAQMAADWFSAHAAEAGLLQLKR
jgi:dienelactone hydrolase